jgi:hypothetical protein
LLLGPAGYLLPAVLVQLSLLPFIQLLLPSLLPMAGKKAFDDDSDDEDAVFDRSEVLTAGDCQKSERQLYCQ